MTLRPYRQCPLRVAPLVRSSCPGALPIDEAVPDWTTSRGRDVSERPLGGAEPARLQLVTHAYPGTYSGHAPPTSCLQKRRNPALAGLTKRAREDSNL